MTLPETDHAPAKDAALALPSGLGLSRGFLRQLLARIVIGRLHVVTPEGERLSSGGSLPGPQAMMVLRRWRAMRRLLLDGDVGLAHAYRDGDFTTPDLTALIELGARNDATLRALVSGTWPARLLNRLRHWRNANSRVGSRRNIPAHYDLGNAFYGHWLDASMTYSSALYTAPTQSLEAAQQDKLDRIIEMLALEGGEHVLEIGCGWGALAERLAQRGCRVTAVTLSPAQLAFAQRRIAEAGLAERVELRLQDYRDITGQFDRIVSIEMFEAVGEKYWPTYFSKLDQCLKPGGKAGLQIITIKPESYQEYHDNPDFIQKYVFPGGMLPTREHLVSLGRAANLAMVKDFGFGLDYARTLGEWRERFWSVWDRVRPLGFDERFRRLWEFYFFYCEAGFRARNIDVRQVVFAKG